MPPAGGVPLTAAQEQEIAAAYAQGEGERSLAARLHVHPRRVRALLAAAGVPIRTKGQTCRLRALAQHAHPLREYTAARLREIYWGPERPSLATLAQRFECAIQTVRDVLAEHGLKIRTPQEQLREDSRLGRRGDFGGHRGMSSEEWERHRETFLAAFRKRSKNRDYLRRMGAAHQRSEERRCSWCGRSITRRPSAFHSAPERTYCSVSCSNRGGHHRRREGPDAPRPLLLAALRAAMRDRPLIAGNLADAAERVGADEREIWTLIEEAP